MSDLAGSTAFTGTALSGSNEASIRDRVARLSTLSPEETADLVHELAAQRAALQRFALAAQANQEGIWDWNMETDEVYYSPRWKEMLGYAEDEIEPHVSAWKRLLHPDDVARATQVVESVCHDERDYEMEFRLRHKAGHYLHVLSRGYPIRCEPGGRVTRIVGTHFDLTARNRIEERVRESEQKFATIFHATPVAKSLATLPDGALYDVNDAWLRLTGFAAKDDVLGKTSAELGLLYDVETRQRLQEEFCRHGAINNAEVTFCTGAGLNRTVLLDLRQIEVGGRQLLLSTNLDITERKQAEEALRHSEERFRVAQELSPDGFTILRPVRNAEGRAVDFTWIYENDAVARMNGTDPKAAVGQCLLTLFPGHKRSPFFEAYQEVAETGRPRVVEAFYRGETIRAPSWFRVVVVPMGQDIAILSQDITARKQTEQDLERTRILLSEGQKIAHVGSWEYIADTQETIWSDEECRIYGFTPGEPSPAYRDMLQKSVHPEDAPILDETFRQAVQGHAPFELEHRIVRPDGSVRIVYNLAYPDFDEEGKLVKYRGATLDITDRKRGEDALKTLNETLEQQVETRTRQLNSANADLLREIEHRKQAEKSAREAEDLYRAVIEDQTETIARVEADGTYVFVNDAYCRFFGKTQNELLGAQWQPVAVAEDVPRIEELLRSLSPACPVVVIENRVYSASSAVRWMQFVNRGFFDSEGHLLEIQAVGRDITDRKNAEEAQRESEERFRHLVGNTPLAVIEWDSDFRISQWSGEAERVFGWRAEECIGKRADECPAIFEEDVAQVSQVVKTLSDGTGLRSVCHNRNYRRDGAVIHCEWYNSAILDRSGRLRSVLSLVLDVTERKRAEQARLEMERRLFHAQKLESLGVVAGGVAHDFNNILAGIMGFADLALMRLPPSEPAREDIATIKQCVQRAADLTRQMLAYSGKGAFVVEPVHLSHLITENLTMLESLVSKKAAIRYNLASTLPEIQADRTQIYQILVNLVINASEALEENTGTITISTEAVYLREAECTGVDGGRLQEGVYVQLAVTDTGCGMDQATVERVFDPFFSTKFTGRGLGLAAVQGIARGHKGVIRVTSEVGKGTTFQVSFPTGHLSSPASPETLSEAESQRRDVVLVVDDEVMVRIVATRIIRSMGLSVLMACDGEEAIRVYREHQNRIACVLLDLVMPKMDGTETLRALRGISPDVRVVLTSGFGMEHVAKWFDGSDLLGFIQKPFQAGTLVAKLKEACECRESRTSGTPDQTDGESSSGTLRT